MSLIKISIFIIFVFLVGFSGFKIEDTQAQQCNAPVCISNEKANTTSSGVTITWNTNVPASSQVHWGPFLGGNRQANNFSPVKNTAVTNHSVNISGLGSNATFCYNVISTASGYTAFGTIFNFTTGSTPQCQLTQAIWSSTAAIYIGESKTLTVTGQGCNGLAMAFDIYELDPGPDDFLRTVNSNFSGNTAVANYTFTSADFVKGGNETLGENVYFEAKVFNTTGNQLDSIKSVDIVFLNTPLPGTGGGTGGTGGGPGGTGGQPGQSVTFEIQPPTQVRSLVDLAKAIGRFLLQIAIPIAVIVIIYAGLLFLRSEERRVGK